MSYILEALKKSEQERQRGAAPTLRAAPAALPSAQRPAVWAYGVLALALLGTGVGIGWLRPWQERSAGKPIPAPQVARTEAPTVVQPQSGPAPDAAQPTLPAASVPTVTAPATAAPAAAAPAKAEEAPLKPARSQEPKTPAVAKNVASLAPPDPFALAPKSEAVALAPQQSLPPKPAAVAPSAMASVPETKPGPMVEVPHPTTRSSEPATEEFLPAVGDLPPAIRQSLPRLAVSVHFYSSQPGASLVSINGHSLRNGEEVSPELKLERVTPSGAILNYKGTRFQIGSQGWEGH